MLKQFLKFASVGAFSTVVQYVILIILTESRLTGPVLASAIGYIGSGILNYLLNYHYTFNSNAGHQTAALKFVTVSTLGLGLNVFLMFAGVHLAGLHYLLCQLLATGVVLLWNFGFNRWWTFHTISHQG